MPQFTVGLPDGKQMVVEADSEDHALAGAQQWFATNVTNKTDTSLTGALTQGISDVTSGVGKTIKDYLSPDTGKAILDSAAAKGDPKYKSASQGFMYPEDGADKHVMGLDWAKLPRAALEQAPGLAVDLGAQALVPKWAGPIGKYLANAATYGMRNAGNEAEKRAVARTGDQSAEPNAEDKAVGVGSTLAQAALGQVGLNKILKPASVGTGVKGIVQAGGNAVKAGLTEGAVGGGQDLISQGAAKAGTDQPIDWQEAKGSAAMSGVNGGAFSLPRSVHDAAVATRLAGTPADEHTQMVGNRLVKAVEAPEDLKNPEKAGAAIKSVQSDLQGEVSRAAQSISNPSENAANAIKRAKSGEVLTERELASIDAENNPLLSSLARQSSSLADLATKGRWSGDRFAGGASEFVRAHAFGLGKFAAGADVLAHAAGQGGVGVDSLMAHLPGAAEAAAAGYGGYKALQAVDKFTGAYTPVHNFAQKFANGGDVRPDVPMGQSPTGPKVAPQNSLTPAQPWGPVPDPVPRFKPDIVEPGIAKIIEKLQRQKQQQFGRDAMPALRQLAEQSKPPAPPPGIDANALNEQVKSALLMSAARRKIEGQRQAEAEAAQSPMINDVGGLDEVRNPAMGKRAQEFISAANALARLRRQPEEEAPPAPVPEPPAAPAAPVSPGVVEPKAVDTRGASPLSTADLLRHLAAEGVPFAAGAAEKAGPKPEPFTLPESPHVFKTPREAAEAIHAEAVAGGKTIRNAEGYKAGTTRRLAGEEAIYMKISNELASSKERGDFHKYLSALWGSDSPEVVQQVRDTMLAEFPHHAATITKHLSDGAIKDLWTKPAKKK